MPLRCLASLTLGLLFAASASADVRVTRVDRDALDHGPVFRPGDVLHSWRMSAVAGSKARPIPDAMAFRTLQLDALQGGPLRIEVTRDGKRLELLLVDGRETVMVSTLPGPTPQELVDESWEAAIEAKDFEAADRHQRAARESLADSGHAVFHWRVASQAQRAAAWADCRAAVDAGVAAVESPLFRARLSEVASYCASFSGAWKDAQKIQIAQVAVLEKVAPDSLLFARLAANLAQIESFSDGAAALKRMDAAVAVAGTACGRCRDVGVIRNFQGDVYANLNRYTEAEAAYREGVVLARGLDDGPMSLAPRLRAWARSLRLLGRLDEAQVALEEALQLVRAAKAPPAEEGAFLNGLGVIAAFRGDFHGAAKQFRAALAMYPPDARTVNAANARMNLGWTLMQSGDLAAAERELRFATAMMEEQDQGANLAVFYNNLSGVLSAQGDHEAALDVIDRTVALHERVNAQSHDMANALVRRALLRDRLGQASESRADWTRAFTILEQMPEDNFLLADPLTERGFAELGRGEGRSALATFERALGLHRAQATESLAMARTLLGAGMAALELGRLPEADTLLDGALKIRARDVPETGAHAEVLHAQGLVAQRRQDAARARTLFCGAADMLDDASLKVGTEALAQARFRALFAQIYRDCVIANVELGASGAALEALERGRARGFRAALELRQLQLAHPGERAALDALAVNLSGEQEALARANDTALDATQRQAARDRVMDLRRERAAHRAQLEKLLPSLAPKSTAVLAGSLASDEAYLAFATGTNRTAVLLLKPDGSVATTLRPLSEKQLEAQVASLRTLVLDPARVAEWQAGSDRLRAALLGPLARELEGTRTLLVSPDGALHNLPFAALWNAEKQAYWVDDHAIGILDALSARAASKAARRTQPPRLLAVGDPLAGTATAAAPGLASELRRSGVSALVPLPAARREVTQIARRYADAVDVLVGAEATERAVRDRAPKADQLHFAVHALLDPERVLDSSLVLAPGQSDRADNDGFLRVHEILGELRLDARLVVLSACDSGLGKELAGEGLVGFSRAFAFAGARATLASLWPVADESTATLMDQFYAARDQGHDATDALRQAMARASRTPVADASDTRGVGGVVARTDPKPDDRLAPFYWAAFQVYGE